MSPFAWRLLRRQRPVRRRNHILAGVLCRRASDSIDTPVRSVHPTKVELLLRRAAALVVALSLGAAGFAECAGWRATPEARMACCSQDDGCPMHRSTEPGARRAITQVQADSCCASAGSDDATPSAGLSASALSQALFTSTFSTSAPIIDPVRLDLWRTGVPRPVGHVARHALLSTFLI